MTLKESVRVLCWPFDRGLALVALAGVQFYRRWISKRKGFRCAAAAVRGGPSCSDVGLAAFQSNTFTAALPILSSQFCLCRESYVAYTSGIEDLFEAASNHLNQFDAFHPSGPIACCPGCDPGGGGDGPL
ncbi:MAG: hypothetical protein U1A77_11710 [Pirellulales bacterium]|jgi:putative component of membrane protein insertase Oxa1/YidC/SpoIIIJ protein YidD